jgi:hypothetical protein
MDRTFEIRKSLDGHFEMIFEEVTSSRILAEHRAAVKYLEMLNARIETHVKEIISNEDGSKGVKEWKHTSKFNT